jgi:hypothetical protein
VVSKHPADRRARAGASCTCCSRSTTPRSPPARGGGQGVRATLEEWQERPPAARLQRSVTRPTCCSWRSRRPDEAAGASDRHRSDRGRARRHVSTWSYLSLTEGSEYTDTPERYREEMAAKGVEGEDLDRRVEQFAERMAKYTEDKLHPRMPEWELVCFYPMSHRREGADNWYALDYEERKRLMGEHGRSGRAYTGRVLQLVTPRPAWTTGSTGSACSPTTCRRQGDRLHDALRRGLGALRGVRALRHRDPPLPADLVAEIGLDRPMPATLDPVPCCCTWTSTRARAATSTSTCVTC